MLSAAPPTPTDTVPMKPTNLRKNSHFRILTLPTFPPQSNDEDVVSQRFSPEELIGGFLAGPENRLAELAASLAIHGVPVFDRPLGAASLEPVASAAKEPSRADIEMLLRGAQDDSLASIFGSDESEDVVSTSPLFDMARYNAARGASDAPAILEYRRLEDVGFLTPLVFYGSSGSGKTRIIEGICQHRRETEPEKTLYYLSATDFSRALADAVRKEQTGLFHQLLAQAHVLAIENADMLAEKEASQQELLPILDEAVRAHKLVVFSFSRNPGTIQGLLPELASRFTSGLLIPTSLPSEETRRFLIERLAGKLALPLDGEMRELCVQRLPSTTGAVCSALVQCSRMLAASNQTLTKEFLENFLQRRSPANQWTLDRIVKTVAKYFAVSVTEMRSKKRSRSLVLARRCVVFFARRLTNATYLEIGRQFSNRDHSTMIHATREIEEALQTDEELRRQIREIARILRAESMISL